MRYVPTPLRILLGLLLFVLLSALTALVALPLLPWRVLRIKLCNLYGKLIGRSILFLAAVRPVVPDRARLTRSMPAIYIANHAATLDLFASIWLCPFGGCGVMKKEMTRIPIFGQLALLSGHLLLDRGNKKKAVAALDDIAALVKAKGLGIWIMPEGTRSPDGRLLPFKRGFVHLALATGLPVVPVLFHGAHKNWAKGSWSFKPMTLDIEVLEPIDTSAWSEETAGDHADFVHDLVASRLRDDQKPLVPRRAA
jgi:1-acyl-sn-glycerol-3-phosphate acyltransferase